MQHFWQLYNPVIRQLFGNNWMETHYLCPFLWISQKKKWEAIWFWGHCQEIKDIWMDFKPCLKVHTLISVQLKSIQLCQMICLSMIFHYQLVKIWNSPQFLTQTQNGPQEFDQTRDMCCYKFLWDTCVYFSPIHILQTSNASPLPPIQCTRA